MNVLILTPDRVGSTLLQRLITVYMLRREFDKPVINLHELTNGLSRYYNTTLNQEIVGKPRGIKWGYYQTLSQVESLLKSSNHYKTSRLAHYHIVARQDSIADQIQFYEYLNREFFVISCRRDNLFEHALSWAIEGHSKVLNVYNTGEKIDSFYQLYKNGITVSRENLHNYLRKYKDYIHWSDTYFNVQSYFNYDQDVSRIEDYILNLDFMQGAKANTWQDMFGQSFTDWNTCHRLLPNIFLEPRQGGKEIGVTKNVPSLENAAEKWNQLKGSDWPNSYNDYQSNAQLLSLKTKKEIDTFFNEQASVTVSENEYKFLSNNLTAYKTTEAQLYKLVDDGFLVTGVPVKLQSLREKKLIIKNYAECMAWYNEWVQENKFGKIFTDTELETLIQLEEERLNQPIDQQTLLQ